ncbi:MAG: GHKL domain-containing protein [Lachnospiraceae bacterium]|nr:GHKL domain-containing protein [Lachnospiraceae bacterium]
MRYDITIILVAYAVLITVAFIIYIFVRKRQQDKHFYEYQDKVLNIQMEEMNDIYMTMRGWRHDYHNHMQAIKAHLEAGQIAEANEYVDKMDDELDRIDFEYKTGNIGVDAILNSKLSLAKKHSIEIKCDTVLHSKISIPQIDLCVLLGNLVDNAIEACDKLEDGQRRFLRIYMCIRQSQLYISVTNATNEVIRKLDKDYISNKRGNHGHGLKRINLTVEKYGGYINRQNEPGVFVTEIMLPLEKD